MDTFESTFQVAGEYNEWRLQGVEVVGIFINNIYCVEAKRATRIQGLPDGELLRDIGATCIELTEVFDAFKTLRVFTMTPSGLARVSRA